MDRKQDERAAVSGQVKDGGDEQSRLGSAGGQDAPAGSDLSRRDFLEGTGAALVAVGATPGLAAADPVAPTGATAEAAPQVTDRKSKGVLVAIAEAGR